ncbi:MAG: 50S ribosomal protein L22 [Parcubacteria group bacterium GW2011_GWF2_42_7]|nr:MAG: 50S ribosomal protein L22 [Parcubacteria group bacterium GW2011_GWA2_40_37]KKS12021.1 MAG: 50S ribosomal protein L22 [Parcubacteria group bacterium GW2011_GWB1_41_5]KKS70820.1 MAG: 50S ribosomal protein L22 [Parcubacteria group bacterium GW2011_GWF2_42_7]
MKAFLKNYRQAPRKVRLVVSLVKGKSVSEAIAELDFLAKRAGLPIKKLLMSAVSNAKNMGIDIENLFIKEFRVDKGLTMKRMMPAAMGTGHRINKRTSHLNILLAERVAAVKKSKKQSCRLSTESTESKALSGK